MGTLTVTQAGEMIADLEGLTGADRERMIHRVRKMAKAGTLRPDPEALDKRGTFALQPIEMFRARLLLAASYLGMETKAVGELIGRARSDRLPVTRHGALHDAVALVQEGKRASFVIRLDRLPELGAWFEFDEPDPAVEWLRDHRSAGHAYAEVRFDLAELFLGLDASGLDLSRVTESKP